MASRKTARNAPSQRSASATSDIPASRRIKSHFASLKEWDAWVNANCAPRRADDTPILAGQTGPRKRATREQMIAIINEQRARYGWPPCDPSNPDA